MSFEVARNSFAEMFEKIAEKYDDIEVLNISTTGLDREKNDLLLRV